MSFKYLLFCQARKAQVRLYKCADSPEPSQLAHTKYVVRIRVETVYAHDMHNFLRFFNSVVKLH